MQLAFELTGTMPLIMHADDIDAADALKAWRNAPENKNFSVGGDDRSPPWTWMTYLYSDGEHVTMPAANVMVALRTAGAQIIMKKQKTYKEISQSGMVITSEFCTLLSNGKQVPIAPFNWPSEAAKIGDNPGPFDEQIELGKKHDIRLYTKRAKIGQSKHIRVRPRFESWAVKGEIEVFAPELTFEIVERLFGFAGRGGLGDWRPACKTPGPYGMFTAKLNELKAKKAG